MLLELNDANPYTVRAYRRAAAAIRGTPAPIAELVRSGRVRELRGVGSGIEGRLRELIETGEIAELTQLEHELAPDLVGLGRYLGLSAQRALSLARALDVHTAEEFRQAAPPDGCATSRASAPRPRHGCWRRSAATGILSHATACCWIGPASSAARSPLRWAAMSPAMCAAGAIMRAPRRGVRRRRSRRGACALCRPPADRDDRRADRAPRARRHRRGCPRRARRRRAGPVRLRADPSDRRARIRRRTRAAARRPGRGDGLRRVGCAVVPAGAARATVSRRAAGAHRGERDPRGPALPLDMVRRTREHRGDGPRGQARGYEYLAICDHTPAVGAVRGLTADDVRRQGEEIAAANRGAGAVQDPARDRVRHPPRRAARPSRRRPRRAGLGPGQRPRGTADAASRDDQAGLCTPCRTRT